MKHRCSLGAYPQYNPPMSFGLARGRELDISGVGYTPFDLPPFETGPIDLCDFFAPCRRDRPLEIEIGSGKGTFLVQQAAAQPQTNFVGMEWAGEFFRYAADRVRRNGIGNVRMLNVDAAEFIRFRLRPGICQTIHVYFPDPWPKSRHHKRRLIQESNLREFHRILAPGVPMAARGDSSSEVRIVTDHAEYFAFMQAEVAKVKDLFSLEPFDRSASARDGEVVGTNFERKYRLEGRPFHAFVLRKHPV